MKDAEATLEITRKKLEAARARIAVLENDCNASKRTIALLNEKTTHDNQLIDALHVRLNPNKHFLRIESVNELNELLETTRSS